jgi:hypothetical protein
MVDRLFNLYCYFKLGLMDLMLCIRLQSNYKGLHYGRSMLLMLIKFSLHSWYAQ